MSSDIDRNRPPFVSVILGVEFQFALEFYVQTIHSTEIFSLDLIVFFCLLANKLACVAVTIIY